MTLAQALAHIAALEAQIDEQARTYTRLCHQISRLKRRAKWAEGKIDYWRRIAETRRGEALARRADEILEEARAAAEALFNLEARE